VTLGSVGLRTIALRNTASLSGVGMGVIDKEIVKSQIFSRKTVRTLHSKTQSKRDGIFQALLENN
jgi:hypothetical protein